MNEHATFRRMRTQRDLKDVVAIERKSFYRHDPDFGVMALHPDSWGEEDIRQVVFREDNTRAWVVEEGDGNVVAWCVYETQGDGYLIRRLLVHPAFRRSNFGRTVLWKLYRKMVRSERRKRLSAFVSLADTDTCGWMAHMGFASELVRNGWDGDTDAVRFTFTTREHIDRETGEPCERSDFEG